MDTDKIKVFGARLRVEATGKLAELERAERVRTQASVQVQCIHPHATTGQDEGQG